MNFKKLYFLIYFLIIAFNIFSTDYYICLGSFIDNKSYSQFNKLLNDNGIVTVFEKVNVKGKNYTRVIYNKKFNRLDNVRLELKKMKKNPAIIKYNVKNLRIRPGVLNNTVNSSSDIKNITKSEDSKQIVQNNLDKNGKPKNLDAKMEQKQAAINIPIDRKPIENRQKSKYLSVNEKGYGNILFSDRQIDYSKEDVSQFKTSFTKPEKIFARCYFNNSLGKLDPGNLWYEIWLNDEFKTKVVFDKSPDPGWDQLQLWISEEDFKKELDNLNPGEYKITILVVENSSAKNQKNLAKGDLTYIVPKEQQ